MQKNWMLVKTTPMGELCSTHASKADAKRIGDAWLTYRKAFDMKGSKIRVKRRK